MAINLSKGQKIDLTKTNPGLSKITVGLGWDTNKYDGGKDFDLDVSLFLTNAAGKVEGESNFVFFNNPQNENGSVVHTGDNRTGAGDGDDEQIKIELAAVPANVEKIAFTITIYEATTATKISDKFPVLMCGSSMKRTAKKLFASILVKTSPLRPA